MARKRSSSEMFTYGQTQIMFRPVNPYALWMCRCSAKKHTLHNNSGKHSLNHRDVQLKYVSDCRNNVYVCSYSHWCDMLALERSRRSLFVRTCSRQNKCPKHMGVGQKNVYLVTICASNQIEHTCFQNSGVCCTCNQLTRLLTQTY